jgi:chromatin segregation and condensation protein Rec8/ScpA/Scc1 (kleisin family)
MSRPSSTLAEAATLEYGMLNFLEVLPQQSFCSFHSITEEEVSTSAILVVFVASVLKRIYNLR